jgi:hypothetical protein
MAASFGATDTPICPQCHKATMNVTRRAPHPTLGCGFELQTFSCSACRHKIKRTANRLGEVAI